MQELYHYTESGLDYVYLVNGFVTRDTPRGQVVSFTNLDDLHRAIGHFIVTERRRLSAPEIRFLRHEIDLSQAALAHLLGVTERTVARWESGAINPSLSAEAAVRLLYQERAEGHADVSHALHLMTESEGRKNRRLELAEADGWAEAA